MEEGTGISLYVLVGIIIFGLFVGISVLFGEGILAKSEDIIACVESYMSGDPTDCGVSDPSELPEDTTNNINTHIGPTGEEWYLLGSRQKHTYMNEFLDTLKQEVPGFEDGIYYKEMYNTTQPSSGWIYGIYDDDGNLINTYSYGQTYDSDYSKYNLGHQRVMQVNDIRLVPDKIRESGYDYYSTNGGYHITYDYTDEQGQRQIYRVFTKTRP